MSADGRVRIIFEGRDIDARPGDSIAAALAEAGEVAFRRTRSGKPRGVFCGMGVCNDCLIVVDEQRSTRACMTPVHEGASVCRQGDLDGPAPSSGTGETAQVESLEAESRDLDSLACDLAIVGAGPAGLAAAALVAKAGLSVVVLDERGEAGGQYFKPRSEGSRHRDAEDGQHRDGRARVEEALQAGASIRMGESVWYARRRDGGGFELGSTSRAAKQVRLSAKAVLLATGAWERPAMVPGWTLPGVMTIGAAQTLVRRYGVFPGRRVAIAGHGPLGLQLADEMRRIGVAPAVVAERAELRIGSALLGMAMSEPALVVKGVAYRIGLLASRTPFLAGWEIAEALGDGRVEEAVFRRIASGEQRRFAVDTVAAGDGFAPQVELARVLGCPVTLDGETGCPVPVRDLDGRTPVAGLWIAGDGGGLGGAQAAFAQGQLAGASIAAALGVPIEVREAGRSFERARSFQKALWSHFTAASRRAPDDATILCRCEEVTAGAVRAAIAEGACDLGAVKRVTRLGMGRCQGRYCIPASIRLLADAGATPMPQRLFAPQLPARLLRAGTALREKPEWGGHRESVPGARPKLARSHPLAVGQVDMVVVGAGVTGVCAAIEAARRGLSVLCLERGRIGGEASGGNAGSLHLQLLSFDFGGKAVAGGAPALRTLPLQRDSIALWHEIHAASGGGFEMSVTGGMMVAEDEAQIAFLEQKARAESSVGITTEVIGRDRIRAIAPAVSDRMVAAAWCPGEGKIDPLGANLALLRMARANGVRFEEEAPVIAIDRDAAGFRIATPAGVVETSKLVIACGGWSAGIGRMMGVNIPVRGAPLQMIVTEPAPPLVGCLLAHADRHLTMKQTSAGTVLIGGAWTAETNSDGQTRTLRDSIEGNLWVAARTVPAIAGLDVTRTWAAMNIDLDGAPLLSPVPGWPGAVVAATANGYTLGPLMGREAATMAISGVVPPSLSAFTLDRFRAPVD